MTSALSSAKAVQGDNGRYHDVDSVLTSR